MIEVLQPGLLATVQDLGRVGYVDIGVGRSGAADLAAHRLANRLVGNQETAATLEITLGGLSLRLRHAATIACTGAWCHLTGAGAMDWHRALSLPAGTTVRLGSPVVGLRSYLAIRGGVAATPVLGSRSTDTLSGLGPPVLTSGMVLDVGHLIAGDPVDDPSVGLPDPARALSRGLIVLPGPRLDWFTDQAWDQLVGANWAVQATSNRIGYRLSGPPLERSRSGELPSEPTLPGAIQVPPDGQPIVLGPDAPVTGGYPVIGVIPRFGPDGLDALAQARPGHTLRFRAR